MDRARILSLIDANPGREGLADALLAALDGRVEYRVEASAIDRDRGPSGQVQSVVDRSVLVSPDLDDLHDKAAAYKVEVERFRDWYGHREARFGPVRSTISSFALSPARLEASPAWREHLATLEYAGRLKAFRDAWDGRDRDGLGEAADRTRFRALGMRLSGVALPVGDAEADASVLLAEEIGAALDAVAEAILAHLNNPQEDVTLLEALLPGDHGQARHASAILTHHARDMRAPNGVMRDIIGFVASIARPGRVDGIERALDGLARNRPDLAVASVSALCRMAPSRPESPATLQGLLDDGHAGGMEAEVEAALSKAREADASSPSFTA